MPPARPKGSTTSTRRSSTRVDQDHNAKLPFAQYTLPLNQSLRSLVRDYGIPFTAIAKGTFVLPNSSTSTSSSKSQSNTQRNFKSVDTPTSVSPGTPSYSSSASPSETAQIGPSSSSPLGTPTLKSAAVPGQIKCPISLTIDQYADLCLQEERVLERVLLNCTHSQSRLPRSFFFNVVNMMIHEEGIDFDSILQADVSSLSSQSQQFQQHRRSASNGKNGPTGAAQSHPTPATKSGTQSYNDHTPTDGQTDMDGKYNNTPNKNTHINDSKFQIPFGNSSSSMSPNSNAITASAAHPGTSVDVVNFSQEWIQGFLLRHTDLLGRVSKSVGSCDIDTFDLWFCEYLSGIYDHSIDSDNIYNMADTGVYRGSSKDDVHVSNTTQNGTIETALNPGKKANTNIPEDRRSIRDGGPAFFQSLATARSLHNALVNHQEAVPTSTIETICADGTSIPPYVMVNHHMINNDTHSTLPTDLIQRLQSKGWTLGYSDDGWIGPEAGYEWLSNHFDPKTRDKANGKSRALLLTGEIRYLSFKFLKYAADHNILLFFFPARTSDVLQPFSVGPGRYLQTLRPIMDAIQDALTGSATVNWLEFFDMMSQSRFVILNKGKVTDSWMNAGLLPFNPQHVVNIKFPNLNNPPLLVKQLQIKYENTASNGKRNGNATSPNITSSSLSNSSATPTSNLLMINENYNNILQKQQQQSKQKIPRSKQNSFTTLQSNVTPTQQPNSGSSNAPVISEDLNEYSKYNSTLGLQQKQLSQGKRNEKQSTGKAQSPLLQTTQPFRRGSNLGNKSPVDGPSSTLKDENGGRAELSTALFLARQVLSAMKAAIPPDPHQFAMSYAKYSSFCNGFSEVVDLFEQLTHPSLQNYVSTNPSLNNSILTSSSQAQETSGNLPTKRRKINENTTSNIAINNTSALSPIASSPLSFPGALAASNSPISNNSFPDSSTTKGRTNSANSMISGVYGSINSNSSNSSNSNNSTSVNRSNSVNNSVSPLMGSVKAGNNLVRSNSSGATSIQTQNGSINMVAGLDFSQLPVSIYNNIAVSSPAGTGNNAAGGNKQGKSGSFSHGSKARSDSNSSTGSSGNRIGSNSDRGSGDLFAQLRESEGWFDGVNLANSGNNNDNAMNNMRQKQNAGYNDGTFLSDLSMISGMNPNSNKRSGISNDNTRRIGNSSNSNNNNSNFNSNSLINDNSKRDKWLMNQISTMGPDMFLQYGGLNGLKDMLENYQDNGGTANVTGARPNSSIENSAFNANMNRAMGTGGIGKNHNSEPNTGSNESSTTGDVSGVNNDQNSSSILNELADGWLNLGMGQKNTTKANTQSNNNNSIKNNSANSSSNNANKSTSGNASSKGNKNTANSSNPSRANMDPNSLRNIAHNMNSINNLSMESMFEMMNSIGGMNAVNGMSGINTNGFRNSGNSANLDSLNNVNMTQLLSSVLGASGSGSDGNKNSVGIKNMNSDKGMGSKDLPIPNDSPSNDSIFLPKNKNSSINSNSPATYIAGSSTTNSSPAILMPHTMSKSSSSGSSTPLVGNKRKFTQSSLASSSSSDFDTTTNNKSQNSPEITTVNMSSIQGPQHESKSNSWGQNANRNVYFGKR